MPSDILISAAIIVKNGEDRIGLAIESALKVADEVVILDTGSTDKTTKIVRNWRETDGRVQVFVSGKFTSKTPIADFHFADARNECLEHCRGEWIFSLDDDEVVETDNLDDLRRFLIEECDKTVGRLKLFYDQLRVTKNDKTLPNHENTGVRLFRSFESNRYVGRIHETLPVSKEGSLPRELMRITHDQSAHDEGERQARNFVMLRKMWEEDHSVNALYYLASDYGRTGHYAEAIGCAEIALRHLSGNGSMSERVLLLQLATLYVKVGMGDKAVDCALRSLFTDPSRAEPYFILGDLCKMLGRWEAAKKWYEQTSSLVFPENTTDKVDRTLYEPSAVNTALQRLAADKERIQSYERQTVDSGAG